MSDSRLSSPGLMNATEMGTVVAVFTKGILFECAMQLSFIEVIIWSYTNSM